MKIAMNRLSCIFAMVLAAIAACSVAPSVASSPLADRGYAVLPEPQRVDIEGADFEFGDKWRLVLGRGVNADDAAAEILREDLKARDGIALAAEGSGSSIDLSIEPGAVKIGQAADKNKQAVEEQAYRLEINSSGIRIIANADTGLFYGAETLVQLVKEAGGKLWLPAATITDWPDLENRIIYWDDNHHLERMDALKHALRQAAFYKINGFAIKLNGHFDYRSAPSVVEPYALSPGQLQELTNYGLKYHVQLIPYLDAPAHVSFILKHPEYAELREFPDSNYELCATNPNSYKLLEGMYQELLDANRGVKVFILSTDEPYYIGLADNPQCNEAALAKKLGSVGKLEAQFLDRTAGYLHARGRNVIFWGEYPLKPKDIPSLPAYLINGETDGAEFDRAFKARGIRQMIYTSTEGVEPFFPNYYPLPKSQLFNPIEEGDRLERMYREISFNPAGKDADLAGVIVAGWGDEGLNPETFWLGYVTATGWGWRPALPAPKEAGERFCRLFYGKGARGMGRVYEWMSRQAEFWDSSWDTAPSTARKPIFGNSYRIFAPRRPARDQTLPLPPVPRGENLRLPFDWSKANARRVKLSQSMMASNHELLDLLNENLKSVEFNQYNLEVYLTIALLYRQNLEMIGELNQISEALSSAQAAAFQFQSEQALGDLDQALNLAAGIRHERNQVLQTAIEVWYRNWFPRVARANGRNCLDEVDDVKDHLPGRTVDMSYLVYRELNLPLGRWFRETQNVRNQYARAHGFPPRSARLNWGDTH